jgi:hypothetical protein
VWRGRAVQSEADWRVRDEVSATLFLYANTYDEFDSMLSVCEFDFDGQTIDAAGMNQYVFRGDRHSSCA